MSRVRKERSGLRCGKRRDRSTAGIVWKEDGGLTEEDWGEGISGGGACISPALSSQSSRNATQRTLAEDGRLARVELGNEMRSWDKPAGIPQQMPSRAHILGTDGVDGVDGGKKGPDNGRNNRQQYVQPTQEWSRISYRIVCVRACVCASGGISKYKSKQSFKWLPHN